MDKINNLLNGKKIIFTYDPTLPGHGWFDDNIQTSLNISISANHWLKVYVHELTHGLQLFLDPDAVNYKGNMELEQCLVQLLFLDIDPDTAYGNLNSDHDDWKKINKFRQNPTEENWNDAVDAFKKSNPNYAKADYNYDWSKFQEMKAYQLLLDASSE